MKYSYFLVILILAIPSWGQNISIDLGPDKVAQNQAFTIKLTVRNEQIESYDKFPEISGFDKIGQSSSSGVTMANGQISSTYEITQNYTPKNQGVFTIPNFSMKVNGETIRVRGKKLTVTAPVQRRQRQSQDPFADMWDPFNRRSQQAPQDFVEVEDEAFMALSTDKEEVYLGEGFTLMFALYLPEEKHADYDLHEPDRQLRDLMKKIKPANCWEESFEIREIKGERVELNGKKYLRFKFLQSAYYPQSLNDIEFAPFDFKLVKYKVSTGRSIFGTRQRQTDYKTFRTKRKVVKVKDLPAHPLKDQVSVGNYRLDEKINRRKVNTGETFDYRFNIYGEGNISGISTPIPSKDDNFDIYDPVTNQKIKREGVSVRGNKTFDYYMIPQEPGEFFLKDYYQWIFFNPDSEKYDTLQSDIRVLVTGESKKNASIESTDLGTFYDLIQIEDNTLSRLKDSSWIKIVVNIFLLTMLLTVAIAIFKK